MKNKLLITLIFILAPAVSMSSVVLCPKLPVTLRWGNKIDDNWRVVYKQDGVNVAGQNIMTKIAKRWFAQGVDINKKDNTSTVSCCIYIDNTNGFLCVERVVLGKSCSPDIDKGKNNVFNCDDF